MNPDGFPEKAETGRNKQKDVSHSSPPPPPPGDELSYFSELSYSRDLGQIDILGENLLFR